MIETFGNFWDESGDAHVITTNGTIKSNKRSVMGRGVALQAKQRFPGLDKILGEALDKTGNRVYHLGLFSDALSRVFNLYSFPVKENWWEAATHERIEKSCIELLNVIPNDYDRIVMVRPGCGNGQLSWEKVRPLCVQHFNNRFLIVERKKT